MHRLRVTVAPETVLAVILSKWDALTRGSLLRGPLSQSAKALRNGSAHPPLYTPGREHLGEFYEQAGNE